MIDTFKCRVCGQNLLQDPLLTYKNMPQNAQYLPDKDSINLDRGIVLKICQCSGCGLIQLSNNPVSYYKESIRAVNVSDEMKEFRRKQFASIIKKHSLKGKKAIEIGCGQGEYLTLIQEAGMYPYGLEYSAESVKRCLQIGLKVSSGYIDNRNYILNNAPFDIFFLLSFLEHFPDPNSALSGISNNLTEEAIGLIEVPNFDMILQEKLFSEFMVDHLLYFTENTLRTTLELNGFEVIECSEQWHRYILSAVVKKRKRLDLSSFEKHQLYIKDEINRYIKCFDNVAIWGAGHQALAIITLADLASKVKFVIDSAKFKQEKFTPVSHIPIISPDNIDYETLDAIIIMAGSFSDEIGRIIKQRVSKINVAILRDYGLEEICQN